MKIPERLVKIYHRLGYSFRDPGLLLEALVHPSYLANKERQKLNSYQRLEFLGDRVINLLAAEELYRRYATSPEGDLTQLSSLLVNNVRLAEVARRLVIGEYILLSKGAEHLRDDDYVLACVFEALAGAIFIDSEGSYFPVRQILNVTLFVDLENVLIRRREFDPKSWLQELAQAKFRQTPRYAVVNHDSEGFTVSVSVGGVLLGQGQGTNQKEATKAAALSVLNSSNDLMKIPYRLLRQRDIFQEIAEGR